ncbi:MAG: DEAD/DEAH box helicase [Acidimicrobiia bacterium]
MSITFAQLGLPEPLVRALAKGGITDPFPIQSAAIPDVMEGRDVSGKAPTGSGKTLAFGLPMLARVARANKNRPRALILAPTRELAEQIKRELAPLAGIASRSVFAIYGGVSYGPQKNALRRGIDVLVATPGRLEDLIEQRLIDLAEVEIVVVDEADRMADMGFMPAVRRILDKTARNRQTMLFSATLDGDVAVLSRDYQRNPVRHDAGTVEPDTIDARHHFWSVDSHDRVQQTAQVVGEMGRSIVFTRTRHGADRLAKQLDKLGVASAVLHGGRSQGQRNAALASFSNGRVKALIATDVAARGIHVEAVASVIHFDLPTDHKDYLHRSGRTARAGATGTVVSLVGRDQERAAKRLQQDLGLRSSFDIPSMASLRNGGHTMGSLPTKRRERDSERGRGRTDRPRGREASAPRRSAEHSSTGNGADKVFSAAKQTPPGAESLYVANLPWTTTDQDLAALFSPFGTVHQTTIIIDRKTGRSRGFGFVDMHPREAATAVDALHGADMEGRDLTVRLARPRGQGA